LKMFMLKSFIIASLMFICVLTGMEMANNGIHKMKGYDDVNDQNPVTIQKKDNQQHAAFLGNDLDSHDINTKKKKLEQMNQYTFFSSMGKKVSDGLSVASETLINLITD